MEGKRSPEIALLLQCGTSGEREGRDETRRLARSVENWQRFFELTIRHAAVPSADLHLARTASDLVPSEVAHQLRVASQASALQSLQLCADLVAIVKAFASFGIDALPFKGPTLAALVYKNVSLRQYDDVDVLVHPGNLERAHLLLVDSGYAPVVPYDKNQRASIRLSEYHEQLSNVESGSIVELHWSLNHRSLTDEIEHWWWENRQLVSIGGTSMRTLGPEQLLLYLCLHGGKHSWARLSWLFDLQHALEAYPDARWDLIWQRARGIGAQRMVCIGLTLVDKLLDGYRLTAPAEKARHTDRVSDEISSLIARRICDSEPDNDALDFRVQLRSRERRRDRLRYTWHILATPHPADIELIGLPRALHRLYHIFRPARLVWKHIVRSERAAG